MTPFSLGILIGRGDIFKSPCQALVNPVNCIGVMGKGLAKEFKYRWPEMYNDYKFKCYTGMMKVRPSFYTADDKMIICLATKHHWRNNADISLIERQLEFLIDVIKKGIIKLDSIAFPALGCGEGNLPWEHVKEIMVSFLMQIADTRYIEIYEPL